MESILKTSMKCYIQSILLVFLHQTSSFYSIIRQQDDIFSGVYTPNTTFTMEAFSSAWLITKRHFVHCRYRFQTHMGNFEGTVFSIFIKDPRSIIMTRDYFDFQVEHLSSTTNTLQNHKLDSILINRLMNRVERFKIDSNSKRIEPSNVVALIPFSCDGASTSGEEVKRIRIAMFLATFWSLYRNNMEVVVSVSSNLDLLLLESFNLPLFDIYKIYDFPYESAWQQPRKMLIKATHDIEENILWEKFEFVYYTDGDQILQMRSANKLKSLIQAGDFILVPHRLHVCIYVTANNLTVCIMFSLDSCSAQRHTRNRAQRSFELLCGARDLGVSNDCKDI